MVEQLNPSDPIDIFDPEVDEFLKNNTKHLFYPAHTVFLNPGVAINGIYYLHSGRTKHSILNVDGSLKVLYNLVAGYFFGESAHFLKKPTSLISESETDIELYFLDEACLEQLSAQSAALRRALMVNCSAKIMTIRYEISSLSFSSPRDRLIRFFVSLADSSRLIDKYWYPLKIHYNQTEIGEIIGVTRVTVNRNLTDLCLDHTLRIIKNRVQISKKCYEDWHEHESRP